MFAFPKPLSPCHGLRGVSHSPSYRNFALEVNKRGPIPFQCSRFGTQQRVPLSLVRPMQGGVQNNALSVCWAKEEEEEEAPVCSGEGDMGELEAMLEKFFEAEGCWPEKVEDGEDDPLVLGSGSMGDWDSEAWMEKLLENCKAEAEARDKEAKEELAFDEQVSSNIDATIFDHMPPACDLAWKESQQAWLDLAINHPITLNKSGCSVHILGIWHQVPTNASALKAVVDAVQPDTIAIEQSPRPQSSKALRAVALELAPQLDKLMALGFPAGIREAHMALSPQDRSVWRKAAFQWDQRNLNIGKTPESYGERYGKLPAIEFLAAAHIATNNQISLEGIDLNEESAESEVLVGKVFKEEYNQQHEQIIRGSAYFSASHLRAVHDPRFDEWLFKSQSKAIMDGSKPLFRDHHDFLGRLGSMSRSPAEKERFWGYREEVESRMTGFAATYAEVVWRIRNLEMLDNLEQLAEGGRKCIVAVVGQGHIASMRALAVARNKM